MFIAGLDMKLRQNRPAGASSTLLNGLVAWYKLDETSGARSDSVGSNTLTDNNTVGYTAGVIGNAASFVSANAESLSRSDAGHVFSIPAVTGATLAFWLYPDVLSGIKGYSGKGDTASLDEWQVYTNGANVAFQVKLSGGGYSVPAKAVTVTTWNCVIVWYDPSAGKCFVQVDNGTPAESAAASAPTADQGGVFALGAVGSSTTRGDGDMDLAGWWSRVLTADERTELYNGGSGFDPTA